MVEDKKDEKKPDLMSFLMSKGVDEKSARMIIKELINANEIDLKTHLTEEETLTFTKASFFADEFGKEGMEDIKEIIETFNDQFMRKRLSYNRMSRGEFIEGVKSELNQQMQEDRTKADKVIR